MLRRIDCHQHFWRYDRDEHAWLDDCMAALRRNFLPGDLQPVLAASRVDACIAVQAAQTLAETRFLLDLAAAHPWIAGVVGWVDLQAEDIEAQFAQFTADRRFVGVRHIVQSEPAGFLARPAFRRGLQALAPHHLAYDLLLYPPQLREATDLVAAMPQQTFVLDHCAKPQIARGERDDWARDLAALARFPNVHCKLSGLVTEADWENWTPASLRPWLDTVLESFGPERLLFGSDWPVCLVASSYARWVETVQEWLRPLPTSAQDAVFGGNAARVYRLP